MSRKETVTLLRAVLAANPNATVKHIVIDDKETPTETEEPLSDYIKLLESDEG